MLCTSARSRALDGNDGKMCVCVVVVVVVVMVVVVVVVVDARVLMMIGAQHTNKYKHTRTHSLTAINARRLHSSERTAAKTATAPSPQSSRSGRADQTRATFATSG